MAEAAKRMLYGSTSDQGCVPVSSSGNPGPVYSDDGRLILSESFTCGNVPDAEELAREVEKLLSGDEYVETWRIWDCEEERLADIRIELHRLEDYDLVISVGPHGICAWRGAIDTSARILASRDPEDCEQKCWQWLRVN